MQNPLAPHLAIAQRGLPFAAADGQDFLRLAHSFSAGFLPLPHPMAVAVRNLQEQRRQWTGGATELLELLQPLVPCQSPSDLSQQLKRCTLTLADSGIELKFQYLHAGTRVIELRREPGEASGEKASPDASPPVATTDQLTENADLKTR